MQSAQNDEQEQRGGGAYQVAHNDFAVSMESSLGRGLLGGVRSLLLEALLHTTNRGGGSSRSASRAARASGGTTTSARGALGRQDLVERLVQLAGHGEGVDGGQET